MAHGCLDFDRQRDGETEKKHRTEKAFLAEVMPVSQGGRQIDRQSTDGQADNIQWLKREGFSLNLVGSITL